MMDLCEYQRGTGNFSDLLIIEERHFTMLREILSA